MANSGSHYHFFETNDARRFDRPPVLGMRLNIPAGTAGRFEPGQRREVEPACHCRVFCFAGRVRAEPWRVCEFFVKKLKFNLGPIPS